MLKSKARSLALLGLIILSSSLLGGTAEAAVAHSPDGTFLYVYSPCAWDQINFPDGEYLAVGNYIQHQDYNVTTVVYRDATSDDDNCGSCTLENLKACKYADFLYFTTHGNSGMMAGIYLKTENAVNTWRNNEADTETRQSQSVSWGGNWAYYARIPASNPAAWYSTHWRSILDQSKAIVILSSCESSPDVGSSVVSAAGGGVCLGYTLCPNTTENQANNTKLLQRMNGSTDAATKRKAGLAYGGGAGYLKGFSLHGEPDITLCPAYESKSPVGEVADAGTGHFQVDTYCHDNVPATEALTFATEGEVEITNVHWVGSGKVNRIEFDWAGTGRWKVAVTAHADKFHSWGAATSSYHEMDGNRVTPNGDNVVWTFYSEGFYTEAPSFTFWGLAALTALFLTSGIFILRRRRTATA